MPIRTVCFLGAAVSAALVLSSPVAAADAPGDKLFADNCAACHQPMGEGVPGAFPALAANAFIQGPSHPVVAVILDGRGGMPTFRNDMSDDEIATVTNYIRSAWGNKGDAVDAAAVKAARGEAKSENAGAALQAH